MSWNIRLSGNREDSLLEVDKQSSSNIANGNQTEEQRILARAIVEAMPGSVIQGNIGGHNAAPGMGGVSLQVILSSR